MDRLEILKDLKEMPPEDFVSNYIFDRCPYVFAERQDFIAWKKQLSRTMDVDSADITVVGSAAIGISLSPYKSFKSFDAQSDIDVAIISPYHFNTAWRFLRKNKNLRYRIPNIQKSAWDRHENGLLYYGTIATDKLLSLMPFGGDWQKASDNASREPSIADREVLFRIYNDYDSLRSYQVNSVKTALPKALAQ